MNEYQQAQEKWKEEIGFASMQFPVYKKSSDLQEWYRLDSAHQFIFLQTKTSKTISVCNDLRESLFVEICKWYAPCSAEEFNKMLEVLRSEINKISYVAKLT